jgi:hypothetical protein
MAQFRFTRNACDTFDDLRDMEAELHKKREACCKLLATEIFEMEKEEMPVFIKSEPITKVILVRAFIQAQGISIGLSEAKRVSEMMTEMLKK